MASIKCFLFSSVHYRFSFERQPIFTRARCVQEMCSLFNFSEGEPIRLDVEVTGATNCEVTWYYNGKAIKPSDKIKLEAAG